MPVHGQWDSEFGVCHDKQTSKIRTNNIGDIIVTTSDTGRSFWAFSFPPFSFFLSPFSSFSSQAIKVRLCS